MLHHVQVGEIDNRYPSKPIEMKVSETGIDLQDVKAISKMALNKGDSQKANDALAIVQYFQMGPHTGAGVYSLEYIKNIDKTLQSQCEGGYLTGITGIRETRKYPVISGEIVKVKAYCMRPQSLAGTQTRKQGK